MLVVVGDNEPQALQDIEIAMNYKMPIIVLDGSPLSKIIVAELFKKKENEKALNNANANVSPKSKKQAKTKRVE